MFRLLGMCGLGILFLMISPSLRLGLVEDYESFTNYMDHNSPVSYVVLGVVILSGLMFMVYRAAQPR
jgi:hypothetical protein